MPSARSFSQTIFFSATEMPYTSLFAREQVAAAEAAFVDHVLGIELGVVVRDHPAGAERAADFLVGLGEQDHVARRAARAGASIAETRSAAPPPCPFMSIEPRPQSSLPTIVGVNGSVFHRERSAGTTSMWWSRTIALPAAGTTVAFSRA